MIAQTNALLAVQELINENDRLRRQIAAGSTSTGSNKPKLSKSEVKIMKDLKRLGSTNIELATAFDVNPATVSRIVRGFYHR